MIPPRDTVQRRYQVANKDIAYIVSMLECYDHFAIVRTVDRAKGWIELMIAPDFLQETEKMMVELAKEISITSIEI